ncbi:oxidoreductase [Ktedonobacter sp. SOSP1-85]|uniref:aldo/keto reductase n=1 Tax=Ktedonobacter sp. SOSP1-85 TaxID=2778367 RepID=UPI0019153729|nr:aldo/keto reductase [Ktedonobacter sp. SOSP1-85]GHO78646.1 oxidoreductase [Ktedonobacter sp. SOSP1-85]
MEKRKLGRSSLEVVPLCLGGNVFGWTADEAVSFKVLDAYVAAGGNFIDSADVYSRWVPGNQGGESETILGKWMKQRGNREQVIIATKVGSEMGPEQKGLSRKYIMQAVEASLKRLQTDYIDLYQSHRDDSKTDPEETMAAYAELVQQGKVRVLGASNFTAERLRLSLQASQKHGYPRYESLQPLYNLYDRADFERDLEPLCLQEQIGVIPYYGLASGFLTGKYRSDKDLPQSSRAQGVKQRYMNERGERILAALDKVAEAHHATQAQVALAWLIARPSMTAPIASATSVEQVNDLMKAIDLKLDEAAIKTLEQASSWQ